MAHARSRGAARPFAAAVAGALVITVRPAGRQRGFKGADPRVNTRRLRRLKVEQPLASIVPDQRDDRQHKADRVRMECP